MAKISERYLNDPVYRVRIDKERWSKKVIRDWMNNGFKEDVRKNDDFKEAIRFYIGTGLGTGGRKGQIRDQILEMLKQGPVSDMTLFKEYKYGASEMNEVVKYFIKDVPPSERVWIAYDEKEEEYYIFAATEDVPDNWVGYVPKDF